MQSEVRDFSAWFRFGLEVEAGIGCRLLGRPAYEPGSRFDTLCLSCFRGKLQRCSLKSDKDLLSQMNLSIKKQFTINLSPQQFFLTTTYFHCGYYWHKKYMARNTEVCRRIIVRDVNAWGVSRLAATRLMTVDRTAVFAELDHDDD